MWYGIEISSLITGPRDTEYVRIDQKAPRQAAGTTGARFFFCREGKRDKGSLLILKWTGAPVQKQNRNLAHPTFRQALNIYLSGRGSWSRPF